MLQERNQQLNDSQIQQKVRSFCIALEGIRDLFLGGLEVARKTVVGTRLEKEMLEPTT